MTAPGREYAAALVGLGAGAAVALWAVGRPWVTASAGGGQVPMVTAEISGRALVPVAAGVGVLLLAGVAGIVATKGGARRVLAFVLLVAAVAGGWACIDVGSGLPAIATNRLSDSLGMAPAAMAGSTWWLVAVGGMALAGASAGATVVRGSGWPAMGGRYERSTPAAAAQRNGTSVPSEGAELSPAQLWDALDRGEDPTTAPEVPQ
jgi:uncharacterized membrane protein (TIGR02234 family)